MMHDPLTLVARNMTNVIAKHSSIKNDLNKIDPIINNLKISFIFTGCNDVFILSETQKKKTELKLLILPGGNMTT